MKIALIDISVFIHHLGWKWQEMDGNGCMGPGSNTGAFTPMQNCHLEHNSRIPCGIDCNEWQ